MFQQIAKPRVCFKTLRGAYAWDVCELLRPPSGFGLQNLTYVVDEPDAFNLSILKQSKVKAIRQAVA